MWICNRYKWLCVSCFMTYLNTIISNEQANYRVKLVFNSLSNLVSTFGFCLNKHSVSKKTFLEPKVNKFPRIQRYKNDAFYIYYIINSSKQRISIRYVNTRNLSSTVIVAHFSNLWFQIAVLYCGDSNFKITADYWLSFVSWVKADKMVYQIKLKFSTIKSLNNYLKY